MSLPKELEQVMKLRGGSVLGKKTILKSDHFPGCQNKRLTPQIDGAPNYRQVLFFFLHFFLFRKIKIAKSTHCICLYFVYQGRFVCKITLILDWKQTS